ncbi:uncharacterized protein MONBRDRAFT_25158 [Monosiga brevicollis MX1]|uniref:Amino acid transporter transmembrane domain-containing protein n=1 Tax=Monosiga brevicollis TaxID=81824 RepID=A9UYK6_MONBE|nr:uncharacterized protein MONBRDRAFT_25158 [Monosiga brevicollis MX1]EDQ89622.1 predicted protein [Monosiga brevicollis MX1]|eukprot:XP_001745651.1 hypothetical protein [Monosiga brevicollis MX1]
MTDDRKPLLSVNQQDGHANVDIEYREGSSSQGHGHGHGNSWVASSSIIVAQMLGAGVLGLPYAASQMGWIGAIIILCVITAFSIYGGLLLGKLRGKNLDIVSYAQLAEYVSDYAGHGKLWRTFVSAIGNTYVLGSCTIYLTTCKLSLEQIFQKCPDAASTVSAACSDTGCYSHGIADLSNTTWLIIAALILYPLVHIRTLSEAGIVSYVGCGTIAFVNAVIVVHSLTTVSAKHHHAAETDLYPASLKDFVNGLTALTFAYGGHVLMIDIQAVMKQPADWPKALYSSQLFMFANYCIIGFLGYAVYGRDVKAPITLSLPDNGLRLATNVCLFIHVAMAYCINSCVLVTNLVEIIWPGTLTAAKATKRQVILRWGFVGTLTLGFAIAISLVVPFFSDLMNVYSSLGIFSLSFAVPVIFYILIEPSLRGFNKIINYGLVLIAIVGCVMGMWAAIEDIADKWKTCHYSI